jgi:hypothetical protein
MHGLGMSLTSVVSLPRAWYYANALPLRPASSCPSTFDNGSPLYVCAKVVPGGDADRGILLLACSVVGTGLALPSLQSGW